jgi:hypothetical protein
MIAFWDIRTTILGYGQPVDRVSAIFLRRNAIFFGENFPF